MEQSTTPAQEPSQGSLIPTPIQTPSSLLQSPTALVINEGEGWILFDDDSEAAIDLWIDAYGCETETSEDAVAVIGRFIKGARLGAFVAIDLREFDLKEIVGD